VAGSSRFPTLPRLLRTLAAILGVTLATLALTEVGFRAYNHFHPSYIFASTSYNRFRGKPYGRNYQDRLNSQGFNDIEHPVRKPPGTFRIVAIGDSFVFGVVPYRDNFLTLLGDRLQAAGDPVEVVNMGIPATGPRDYLSMLLHEGLRLHPDLVLCFVFVGNDLTESLPPGPGPHLLVVDFFRFLFKVVPSIQGRIIHGPAEYREDTPNLGHAKYLQVERARAAVFDTRWAPFAARARDATEALLAMRSLCAARGAGFAVVLIPDEMQVDPSLRREVLALSKPDQRAGYDFRRPNRVLTDALQAGGVPVLDLLDPFVREGEDTRLYRRDDSHWNIAGNAVAAEELQRWLEGHRALFRLP
jgi:lysophospholipase L1-like esterase